jgi:hypothetical protein
MENVVTFYAHLTHSITAIRYIYSHFVILWSFSKFLPFWYIVLKIWQLWSRRQAQKEENGKVAKRGHLCVTSVTPQQGDQMGLGKNGPKCGQTQCSPKINT